MKKTLVVHHYPGIGDLVWHIPYIRAIACSSAGGKVTVMARPSCRAADLLSGEECVEGVIEHDYRPRNKSRGHHEGFLGKLKFIAELRRNKFDRIVIFSGRPRYAILALFAGIPVRSGFGFRAIQRLYLNRGPYIQPYEGGGSPVYAEATAFSIAQGFVKRGCVPKLSVPSLLVDQARTDFASLPRPLYAFAIGASEAKKNWGGEKFLALAKKLIDSGCGIVFLGGPGEREEAEILFTAKNGLHVNSFRMMCQASVIKSAAALAACDYCVGNDTGMLNVAVACDVPSFGLFGNTPPLTHDPLLNAIQANSMADISVVTVLECLQVFAMSTISVSTATS